MRRLYVIVVRSTTGTYRVHTFFFFFVFFISKDFSRELTRCTRRCTRAYYTRFECTASSSAEPLRTPPGREVIAAPGLNLNVDGSNIIFFFFFFPAVAKKLLLVLSAAVTFAQRIIVRNTYFH